MKKLRIRCSGNLGDGKCKLLAYDDGYCKLHHPEYRIKVLERQITELRRGRLWQPSIKERLSEKEHELEWQKFQLAAEEAINEEI